MESNLDQTEDIYTRCAVEDKTKVLKKYEAAHQKKRVHATKNPMVLMWFGQKNVLFSN